ncbi:hypothetical protein PCE1_002901 [Barthelona sp. PCE]
MDLFCLEPTEESLEKAASFTIEVDNCVEHLLNQKTENIDKCEELLKEVRRLSEMIVDFEHKNCGSPLICEFSKIRCIIHRSMSALINHISASKVMSASPRKLPQIKKILDMPINQDSPTHSNRKLITASNVRIKLTPQEYQKLIEMRRKRGLEMPSIK